MAVSNKLNVGILYDPAIPFLVIQTTEVQTYVQQQIVNEYHTKLSSYYKLDTIKIPSSTVEWIHKLWFIE